MRLRTSQDESGLEPRDLEGKSSGFLVRPRRAKKLGIHFRQFSPTSGSEAWGFWSCVSAVLSEVAMAGCSLVVLLVFFSVGFVMLLFCCCCCCCCFLGGALDGVFV